MSNDDTPRICYYCDEPLQQDDTVDWCWIKRGPDGCGVESLKVHDSCAAPLIMTAKKIRELTKETADRLTAGLEAAFVDPVPAVVTKLEEAGIKSDALDDMVHEVMSNAASGVNNEGMEAQVRFLMSEGYVPLTLLAS